MIEYILWFVILFEFGLIALWRNRAIVMREAALAHEEQLNRIALREAGREVP